MASAVPHSDVADAGPAFQLGPHTLRIPMSLFATNRQRLCARLQAEEGERLPPNAVIVLQGGMSEQRHDTDHEPLFRQVRSRC